MKNITSFSILILLFSINGICHAISKDPVKSFMELVKQVDIFISSSPISSKSEEYSDSKSGKLHYLVKTTKIPGTDLSYDVQKTDSLIDPIIGYIVLKIQIESNARYGDIKPTIYKYGSGYSYLEDAQNNKNFSVCTNAISPSVTKLPAGARSIKLPTMPEPTTEEWCTGYIKINYTFKEGMWQFNGIDTERPEVPSRIKTGLMRVYFREHAYKNDNWNKALTPH